MTDILCHILPDADDGAETMEDALSMARAAAASGVKTLLATPHCNLPGSVEKNYVSYDLRDRFVALCLAVRQAGIPLTILPGAEILCTPDLPELLLQKKLLPLAGTRYLLVEFIFDEPQSYIDDMLQAVIDHGFIPVIAHPERYDAVQQEPYAAAQWLEQGCVIQLNKGSILGTLGHRAEQTAHWLLDRGFAHVAASDAHAPSVRTTPLQELYAFLSQAYSPAYADLLLNSNPSRMIQKLPVRQIHK